MKYITYEEPLKGKTFTENQMHEVYRDLADKAEYPDFECWKTDMLKSGVFEEVQLLTASESKPLFLYKKMKFKEDTNMCKRTFLFPEEAEAKVKAM